MADGFELPENVAGLDTTSRSWNGVTVELHQYTCTGRVLFPIQRHAGSSRLGAQLEAVGRHPAEARSAPHVPNPVAYKPRQLYFAPARMDVWAHSADARYLRCGGISFDVERLQERLGIARPAVHLHEPRLRLFDDRLWTLIKLLTEAIDNADPSAQLYGDSLTAAIGARLFEAPHVGKGSDCGLSALQLKDALHYLEAKMPARVDLATLSGLAGLSQSHYSRAFKASTGLAPYQWQLHARVERAKDLLLNTNSPLGDIADATGFADTVHFGRTFRKVTGASPAAWRVDRLT